MKRSNYCLFEDPDSGRDPAPRVNNVEDLEKIIERITMKFFIDKFDYPDSASVVVGVYQVKVDVFPLEYLWT